MTLSSAWKIRAGPASCRRRRFWAKYRANKIEKNEIDLVESNLATTAGTCAIMGTASTMAILSEVLGVMPINSATAPAVHADRLRIAENTGEIAATKILQKKITPKNYINKKSFENAIKVVDIKHKAIYETSTAYHGIMEPMNCVAHINKMHELPK